MDTIKGVIDYVRLQKEESLWGIAEFKASPTLTERLLSQYPQVFRGHMVSMEGLELSAVGVWPCEIVDGMEFSLEGEFKRHSSFGWQFNVMSAIEELPTTNDGLRAYLSSGFIKGIGHSLADRIFEKFPDPLTIFEQDIDSLLLIDGIGQKKLEKIKESWQENGQMRVFVGWAVEKAQMTTGLAVKAFKKWGGRSQYEIEVNPWILAELRQVGFAQADQIAHNLGVSPDSPKRIEAGIKYVLSQAESPGGLSHTKGKVKVDVQGGQSFLPYQEMVESASAILEVDSGKVTEQLDRLIDQGQQRFDLGEDYAQGGGVTIQDVFSNGQKVTAVYLTKTYKREGRVAQRIKMFQDTPVSRILTEVAEWGDAEWKEFFSGLVTKGIKLTDEQQAAVKSALSEKVSILTGGPGVGKCLGKGTPVLMYDGSIKAVEDIVMGDLLMGPDSKPRTVLGTNIGYGEMYRIDPVKGDSWICNDVHVLTLVRSGTGEIRDIPLNEFLALSKGAKWRQKGKLFRVGVEFPEQETSMSPYLIGLWLGDGTRAFPQITTGSKRVRDYLIEKVASVHNRTPRIQKGSGCWEISLTRKPGTYNSVRESNVFTDAFCECMTNDKEVKLIPSQYLINSRKNRLDLLAGLMDSDGYVHKGGCEIITKWKRLSDDILYLARSLGFAAYVAEKVVNDTVYWRVTISGDLSVVPTIRRKASPRKQIKNVLRTGFKVTPIGEDTYYGFTLDGDGRFLLGDFTVTHNTFTMKSLVDWLLDQGLRVTLAAPTGKASKVLAQATGRQASTIHRLLGYNGSQFQVPAYEGEREGHDDGLQPKPDMLIIDETSMVDLWLVDSLLQRVSKNTHILFVGDEDQLPSVGAGFVLGDMIASGSIPVSRLTKVHRQAEHSAIVKNARLINAGETGLIARQPVDKHPDFFIATIKDTGKIASEVVAMVTERIPDRFGYKPEDIQILTPRNSGETGASGLNYRMQAILNLPHPDKEEHRTPTQVYRVGDPVMQIKNRYGKEKFVPWHNSVANGGTALWGGPRPGQVDVFNGDQGVIKGYAKNTSGKWVFVVEVDDFLVEYSREEMAENLVLSHAITCHKSQGGQFPVVVMPLTWEHWALLSRKLVYTAITRAKKMVVLVVQPGKDGGLYTGPLGKAIRNNEPNLRHTALDWRLGD